MVAVIKRGEIWVGNLNPSRGHEIGKIRPVLIMQSDQLNADITAMLIILPLSTQVYPTFKHWRITIPARNRLLKPCQVITDQPRALDRNRIGAGPLATLTYEEMAAVEKSLMGVLGLL